MIPQGVSLTIKRGNEEFNLNTEQIKLEDYELSNSPVSLSLGKIPGQIGGFWLASNTEIRQMNLVWRLNGFSQENYFELRQTVLSVFKSTNYPLLVTFNLPGNKVRSVYAFPQGVPRFTNKVGFSELVSVSLVAPDPRFFDPVELTETLTLFFSGMPVPTPVPTPVGGNLLYSEEGLVYGDSLSSIEYPLIRIGGPIRSPQIHNLTTGKKLSFPGLFIVSGDYIDIDLRGGAQRNFKTIVNSEDINVADWLSPDSDLFDWALIPPGHPLPSGGFSDGNNLILAQGIQTSEVTYFTLTWNNRYEGV